jgi:hypothetical protein
LAKLDERFRSWRQFAEVRMDRSATPLVVAVAAFVVVVVLVAADDVVLVVELEEELLPQPAARSAKTAQRTTAETVPACRRIGPTVAPSQSTSSVRFSGKAMR